MEKLFEETIQNIRKIRYLVEMGVFEDDEKYPLYCFKENQGFIGDLIKELEIVKQIIKNTY